MPSSKDLSSSAMLSPPSVTPLPSTLLAWAKCSTAMATIALLLLTLSTVGCTPLDALARGVAVTEQHPPLKQTLEAVKTTIDATVPIPFSGTAAKAILILGLGFLSLTLTKGDKKP